jgi:hypothetical protein
MFLTMVIAALIVDGLFSLAGIIPETRPGRGDIFTAVELNYKLVLNVLGVAIFAVLMWMTRQRAPSAEPATAR